MTSNPFLKRLLGEDAGARAQAELDTPPELAPPPQDAEQAEAPPEPDQVEQIDPSTTVPTVQELVQQWKQGEHMEVATRLMFTAASYRDFVDLVFQIGHSDGLQLGVLLDELADSEKIEPPKTPPQYADVLNRVSGASGEENVL